MQINGPITPQLAGNIVGPVQTLPVPGDVFVCGTDVTAHIAVTNLVYCTAVFFYDPISRARAMIHYNPMSGPREGDFRWCVNHLQEKYGAQAAGLTIALFNNSHSSSGVQFSTTIYKLDRVTNFLVRALGAAHTTMTVNRYLFRGSIGLMDAGGNVCACAGPAIQDSVQAKKMNWYYATPNRTLPRKGLIGNY